MTISFGPMHHNWITLSLTHLYCCGILKQDALPRRRFRSVDIVVAVLLYLEDVFISRCTDACTAVQFLAVHFWHFVSFLVTPQSLFRILMCGLPLQCPTCTHHGENQGHNVLVLRSKFLVHATILGCGLQIGAVGASPGSLCTMVNGPGILVTIDEKSHNLHHLPPSPPLSHFRFFVCVCQALNHLVACLSNSTFGGNEEL